MAKEGNAQQVNITTERMDEGLVKIVALAAVDKLEAAPRVMAPSPQPGAPPKPEVAEEAEEAPPHMFQRGAVGAEASAGKLDNRAKLKITVAHYAVNHPAVLRATLEKVPEQAKPALRRAIAVSVAGYEKALEALE